MKGHGQAGFFNYKVIRLNRGDRIFHDLAYRTPILFETDVFVKLVGVRIQRTGQTQRNGSQVGNHPFVFYQHKLLAAAVHILEYITGVT